MAAPNMDEKVTVRLTPQKQSDGSIVFNWNDNGRARLGLLAAGSSPHREAARALDAWKAAQGRAGRGLGPAAAPRGTSAARRQPPPLSTARPATSGTPTVTLTRRHAENACRNYERQVGSRRRP